MISTNVTVWDEIEQMNKYENILKSIQGVKKMQVPSNVQSIIASHLTGISKTPILQQENAIKKQLNALKSLHMPYTPGAPRAVETAAKPKSEASATPVPDVWKPRAVWKPKGTRRVLRKNRKSRHNRK